MRIVFFFLGVGGFDFGFMCVGFDVIWVNEYDWDIWEIYVKNYGYMYLEKRSIMDVDVVDILDCDGMIGGLFC